VFWKIIATGFGSGYSPFAPGTAGALVGCVIIKWCDSIVINNCFGVDWGPWDLLLILIAVFFVLGIISSKKLEAEWGHDPSKIVVDEMVGVWIALLGIPLSMLNLALALLLFRIFDIWKPLGIRQMEQLPGGWGVMMDDVLAGIYSMVLMHLYLQITT
jgi:phosphatidylglycerophosphatase A